MEQVDYKHLVESAGVGSHEVPSVGDVPPIDGIKVAKVEEQLNEENKDRMEPMTRAQVEGLRSLLRKEAESIVLDNPKGKITARPVAGRPDLHSPALAKAREMSSSNDHIIFANRTPLQREFREYQGFAPVLDETGKEITVMDTVAMKMPNVQYDEVVGGPRQERRSAREARSPEKQFKDVAKQEGLQTFGDITYDDGSNDGK
jgi:hypothetical protein